MISLVSSSCHVKEFVLATVTFGLLIMNRNIIWISVKLCGGGGSIGEYTIQIIELN